MNSHVKTTTILCAAGGLVAAAVALGSRSNAATPPAPPSPLPPITAEACTGDAASAGRADFGVGHFGAALSSHKILQGAGGDVHLAVDLGVIERPGDKRAPVNMAIVIDHSGSMAGDKMDKAREAARGIVERLSGEDRVSLVQYDDDAQVLVPSIAVDLEGKRRLLAAIDGIRDDGGTNLHDGMMLGVAEARRSMGGQRINRVVLLSDGQANVGVVDPRAIARAAGQAADSGVRITTIGLGIDYNEDLMEMVAETGRGQYYFVENAASLEGVFAGELRSMQGTIGTRAEIRLTPACTGVEIAEVYGYESRRDGNDVIVPLADLFGGEKRKLVVRLKGPAGSVGKKALVRATLAFDETSGGGRKTASVEVGVEVSSDAQAVRASVDSEVMTKVEEIETARALRAAAEAYDRGDVEEAKGINRQQRARAEKRAAQYNYKPAAAQDMYEAMDKQDAVMGTAAPASAEGRAASKASKAGARDFAKQ
jgi:Ca-activated chloride channel family protein